MEIDFWEQSPEDAGALFPAIQDTVTYTIQQAVQNSNRPSGSPPSGSQRHFARPLTQSISSGRSK